MGQCSLARFPFIFPLVSRREAMLFVLAEFSPEDLTPAAVARCLCMFMRTCSKNSCASALPTADHLAEGLSVTARRAPPLPPNQRGRLPFAPFNYLLSVCPISLADLSILYSVEPEWKVDEFVSAVNEANPNLSLYAVS